jgi:Family of unknown function (DUF6496)
MDDVARGVVMMRAAMRGIARSGMRQPARCVIGVGNIRVRGARVAEQMQFSTSTRPRAPGARAFASVACEREDSHQEKLMARYGKAASKRVESAMRRRKKGTLKSGKGGKGGRVKSRKQAIAIGLSEARKKGAKVPRKRGGRKRSGGKKRSR